MGFTLCTKTKIDVIHAHGAVPLAAGWLLSRIYGKPLVVTFHGFQRLWFKGTIWKSASELKITYPAIKFLTTTADVVIAQSKKFGEVVSNLYGVDPRRIFVVPHVIDEEDFTFTPVPSSEKPSVLFVGALARVYGIDLFIKAAPFVVENLPETEFFIVGKGPQRDRLQKLISTLKLEESVFLVGPVYDRKKLARYYQDAKVVVIPQKYEGYFLSLVALEALAAGRPIVTTQTLDLELYLNGIFQASFDPKDIAEKTTEILNLDDRRYSALARSARKYYEDHCSKSVIGSKLEKLYFALSQKKS
jgi:glycosyltransferase involved in cell wall biosynthesis